MLSHFKSPPPAAPLDRRLFLKSGLLRVGALSAGSTLLLSPRVLAQAAKVGGAGKVPTKFIHACMTLPYSGFPLLRALAGIKGAGFSHVAWGVSHRDSAGQTRDVMAVDAPPAQAGELGRICRDFGLEPAKMFARVAPDLPNAIAGLTNRIEQAAKAGIQQLLIYGHSNSKDPKLWVERLKQLGPIAADHNVMLVIKQHGGEMTGTGEALAKILREVNHPHVQMCYDAGNIAWYQNVDPVKDIATCADLVRGFCLKDHRYWPVKSTPAPGHGEIDHYRLFAPVAFTGQTIILAYERIDPSLPRPRPPETDPAVIDGWARASREYIETVVKGVHETLGATSQSAAR